MTLRRSIVPPGACTTMSAHDAATMSDSRDACGMGTRGEHWMLAGGNSAKSLGTAP